MFMRLPALSASEGQEARRFDEPKISAAAFVGEKCRFQFCIERYQSIRHLFLSLAKTLAVTCLLRHPCRGSSVFNGLQASPQAFCPGRFSLGKSKTQARKT